MSVMVHFTVDGICRRGGSNQTRKLEMTCEDLQRQLGLGVTPHHC